MHPVRKRREELGLSMEQAAVNSDLSYSMWTKLERGERMLSFKRAQRVAPVLQWTVPELLLALDSAQRANAVEKDSHSSQATRSA